MGIYHWLTFLLLNIIANYSFSLTAGQNCFSCRIEVKSLDKPINLTGTWLFTRNDDPANSNLDINTDDWVLIDTPGPWSKAYNDGKLFETGWYRGNFKFAKELIGQKAIFYLDAYMSPLKIYKDGELFWQRDGKDSTHHYYAIQPIPLVFNITKELHNFTFRVETPLMVGVYQLPFQLRPYKKKDNYINWFAILCGHIRFISAWVIAFSGLFCILIYAKTQYSMYLVSAFTGLGVFPFYAFPHDLFIKFFEPKNLLILHYYGIMYMALGNLLFVQYFDRFYPKINKANLFFVSLLSVSLAILFFRFDLKMFQIVRKSIFLYSIWMASHFVFSAVRAYRNKVDRVFILVIGFTLFWIASVHDILLALGVIKSTSLIFLGTFVATASNIIITADIFADTFRENKKLLKDVEEINKGLEHEVAIRTKSLFDTTQSLSTILKSLPQGVLVINANLKVAAEYSESVYNLFDTQKVENEDIFSLVFGQSVLSEDKLSQVKSAFEFIMGEDQLNFEANAELLPKQLTIKSTKHNKIFKLGWTPIFDQDLVSRLVLTVVDLTNFKKLEKDSQLSKLRTQIIELYIDGAFKKVHDFISNNLSFLQKYFDSLGESVEQNQVNELFRIVHSIKGNARLFNLTTLTDTAHKSENFLSELRNKKRSSKESLVRELSQIRSFLAEFMDISKDLETGHHLGARKVQSDILNDIKMFPINIPYLNFETKLEDILKYKKINTIFSDLQLSLNEIAAVLGKEQPQLDLKIEENIYLSPNLFASINDILVHLTRNSIDHGIETAEERLQENKPKEGKIEVIVSVDEHQLTINYKDDGKGLDVDKIIHKAKELNIPMSDHPTESEISQVIFSPSFSTSESVSTISGRGFGMDIVSHEVARWRGSLQWPSCNGEATESKFVAIHLQLSLHCEGALWSTKPNQQHLAS